MVGMMVVHSVHFTKVYRSAAYVAKSVVAAGLADRLKVYVAYAIGVVHWLSVNVATFDTAKIANEKIAASSTNFLTVPGAIIRDLKLRQSIFYPTTNCETSFPVICPIGSTPTPEY